MSFTPPNSPELALATKDFLLPYTKDGTLLRRNPSNLAQTIFSQQENWRLALDKTGKIIGCFEVRSPPTAPETTFEMGSVISTQAGLGTKLLQAFNQLEQTRGSLKMAITKDVETATNFFQKRTGGVLLSSEQFPEWLKTRANDRYLIQWS